MSFLEKLEGYAPPSPSSHKPLPVFTLAPCELSVILVTFTHELTNGGIVAGQLSVNDVGFRHLQTTNHVHAIGVRDVRFSNGHLPRWLIIGR